MIHLAPGRLQVVMYTGGHGGEFMCYWLSKHSDCYETDTAVLPNNRYILPGVSPATVFKIDSQGSDKAFFYPCHPVAVSNQLADHINNGQANLFVLDNNSPRYRGYYLFLFLLKTYYYKFSIYEGLKGTEPYIKNFIDANTLELEKQLGRRFYYRHEIESIMNQQPVLSIEQAVIQWMKFSNIAAKTPMWKIPKEYSKFHFVDTQELYFNNTLSTYKDICQYANIQPTQPCHGIAEYVQQNIKLIETYSELDFDSFLNIDVESLKYMLCRMIEKHHAEEH